MLAVAEMNAMLHAAEAKLIQKRDELKQVTDSVDALRAKCDEAVNEKQRLDDQSQQTKNRLIRAEKLTTLLAQEQIRWAADYEKLAKDLELIVGM